MSTGPVSKESIKEANPALHQSSLLRLNPHLRISQRLAFLVLVTKPSARVPPGENVHRDHNRQELQTSKVHLVCAQVFHQSLCRLRQSKNCPEVHSQRCRKSNRCEDLESTRRGFARPPDECDEHHDEEEECKDLEGKTSEKNVVGCRGVFAIAVRNADHCRAGNLDDSRDHVADNEYPEDEFRRYWCELSTDPVNCNADQGIYRGLQVYVSLQ